MYTISNIQDLILVMLFLASCCLGESPGSRNAGTSLVNGKISPLKEDDAWVEPKLIPIMNLRFGLTVRCYEYVGYYAGICWLNS